jgi:hypothetical protein
LDTHQECGLALFLILLWIVVGVVIISIFYYSWKSFYFISVERSFVDQHSVCLPWVLTFLASLYFLTFLSFHLAVLLQGCC